ncbi:MAG: S8 family serine peptidase [Chloroflexi bacterium]|nr:S8 family serine peptidase [Chloroflexota bacterium]
MRSSPSQQAVESPLAWLLAFGLLLWAIFLTLGVQGGALLTAWLGELTKLSFSARQILAIGLVQTPLLAAPAAGLLLLKARPGAVARLTLLATAAAGMLMLPRVAFAPEAVYAAGLTRGLISMGFGLLLWVRAARDDGLMLKPRLGAAGFATTLAGIWMIPWWLYGALGDWFDIFVAGFQAAGMAFLLTGMAAYLMPRLVKWGGTPASNIGVGGFALATAILLTAGAWGQMDYQSLLMLAAPALGFPLAVLGARRAKYDLWSAWLLLFLAAFGPLAFSDPRETRLIGAISADTAAWTMRAAALNFGIGWFLTLLMAFFAPRRSFLERRVWAPLAGLAWVGGFALYLGMGQPGFYGDDFFVVLKTQADLKPALAIEDLNERRAWVYETLVDTADKEQAGLIAWLEARNIPYTRYYLVNGIEIHASVLRRWQLARRSEVARVLYSPELRPLPKPLAPEPGANHAPQEPTWGLEAIQAPRVWSELGVRGEGIVIGQSDSGVDGAHPALAEAYRGRDMGDDYNWYDPWGDTRSPVDLSGHGTHTLGTALGRGNIGVAPAATWFACVNLQRNLGNPANYLDCMQFMLAPHPQNGDPLRDGRPELAADVSTNSWGCPPKLEGCDQRTLWQATEALRAAGIMFVVAAGNDGPACNSLQTPPGNQGNALSVGAMNKERELALFSSRGPETLSPDGAIGPDLIAPGVWITSAWPGGSYNTTDGTSMAAPHVAGVVALMWSANPELRGDVAATEQILIETAAPYAGPDDGCGVPGEYPDTGAGYGALDAYAAVKRALELRGE